MRPSNGRLAGRSCPFAAGVCALAAAVLLGLALAPRSSALSPVATSARIYTPFTPTGASRLATVLRHGSCFAGSLAANRRDAWRCTVGNLIYDPCFKSPMSAALLCVRGPWATSAVRLALTKPLPVAGNRLAPGLHGLPWAVHLLDGRRCTLLTGATTGIGGKRLNYGCDRGRQGLWGSPIRSSQPWRIYAAVPGAARLTELVSIHYAWF